MRIFRLDLALDEADSPGRGDLLIAPRTVYRVLEARPCESRIWANRWTLEVDPIGAPGPATPTLIDDGCRTWNTRPYRRGERPAEFFATIARGVESGRTLPPDGEVPGWDGLPVPEATPG